MGSRPLGKESNKETRGEGMRELSVISGIAEQVFECNICENRIKSCDACGRDFAPNDAILHVTHDMLNYHFCSHACQEKFWDLGAYKLVVPA